MPTIRDTLERAWSAAHEAGLTQDQLTTRTGLPMSRWTIVRKLQGRLAMTVDEAVAIGRALGVDVKATRKRRGRK